MADADGQTETPKVVRRARRGSVTITEASTGWLTQQAARMEAERAALDADDGEDDVPLEGWNWIPDEAQGYVPAQYKGEGAGGTAMYLALGKAEPEAIAVKAVGSAISAMSTLKRHVDDMVKMEEVNEAAVLQNVRLRFERRIIYTNIGEAHAHAGAFADRLGAGASLQPAATAAPALAWARQGPGLGGAPAGACWLQKRLASSRRACQFPKLKPRSPR